VSTSPTVLIVEDDRKMARVFATSLEAEGYRVLEASTGRRAMEEVRTRNPDVIVLDLGLPDIDGLELVPELRQHTTVPILVVSARLQDADKVRALDAGADDYLTKPFSVPELLARLRVGLRTRARVGDTAESLVTFGDFAFDLKGRTLRRGDRFLHLSPTEFKLLATLARHADEVVTTSALLKETWGSAHRTKAGYVRVYMHALRRKIEDDPTRPKFLVSESGLGYRLQTERTPDPGGQPR
jgi:two-component system KDP operon response regulator KdpE